MIQSRMNKKSIKRMMKKFLLTIAPIVLFLFVGVWFTEDILTACLVTLCIAVLFILMCVWTNFVDKFFDD